MTLLYGIAATAVVWLFLHEFANANTAGLTKIIRVAGSVVAFGAAAILGLRGRIDIALLLASLGVWLGWSGFRISRVGMAGTPDSPSRVRSTMLEMELDHDTGEIDGSVLAGAFAGRRLNSLDEASLHRLLSECRAGDPEGVRLLEVYLDRRFPRWRETAQRNDQTRPGASSSSGAMSDEEAYLILGLQQGASLDEIRRAHRKLMKKLHPDQGGSTYLATRVNQAKEILLSRQR